MTDRCIRCGKSEAAHNMMGSDDVPYRDDTGCRYINLEALEVLEDTLSEVRLQLRNAWAKLGCRCLFDVFNRKETEDPHCPYHGFQQRDSEGWDPLGELRHENEVLKKAYENIFCPGPGYSYYGGVCHHGQSRTHRLVADDLFKKEEASG